MKITFITGHLCKERHALLNELALDLGENGAEVTVLTGFPSRRISNEIREYYLQNPIEHISENVVVKRIGTQKGEGTGLFVRMINYLILTRKLYKEAKNTETDVYYIYSSPPFLGWIGGKLAKFAPTLYNAQDLFPDTLIHMKNLSEKLLLIKYFRYKEKKAYQDNTRIVTISNQMKNTIAELGCPTEKIDVIYNWADTLNLHHVSKSDNLLMDELGVDKTKFTVSYAGDIGLFQGWDVVLDAAKVLEKKNPKVQFVIIGSGSYKKQMEERIKNEKISNVKVYPLQSASRLSEIYSIGDIEMVPIEKGITKMALPSKIGVIMATGSPLLALVDNGSDIEKIIKDNKAGVALEPGSAEKLVEAIEYCVKNKVNLNDWGNNARRFAELNYSRKIQTQKYYDIINRLCQ
ncbi:glycosyltransferase family 4 protein [Clostridium perfringens]